MGSNIDGQLGGGSTPYFHTPRQIAVPMPGDTRVIAVAACYSHSLFVTADGRLFAMGNNDRGQLGDGTTTKRTIPTEVSVPGNMSVTAVVAGTYYSLFITSDGKLWIMGALTGGDQFTDEPTEVPVQDNASVVTAVAGGFHILFVTSEDTLWGMGSNSFGQLGGGTTTSSSTPVFVASDVVAAAAGEQHSLYVTASKRLYAMGFNYHGQLGNGTTTDRSTPGQVPGASNVIAVAAGRHGSLYVTGDGSLWVMGENTYGQLGLPISWGARLTPMSLVDYDRGGVTAVTAGGYHTLFIAEGTLYGMGRNADYQIVDSTSGFPPPIESPTRIYGPAILSVTPKTPSPLAPSAGTETFTVKNNGSGTMHWTAEMLTGGTWARITSGTSGANTGTIIVTYDANPYGGVQRTASIRITADSAGNNPITRIIEQQANPGPPVLTVSPITKQILGTGAGTLSFFVANTGSGSMPWTAEIISSGTWARIASGASGTNNGAVNVAYDENPAGSPLRTASIRITSTGAANNPVAVEIEQVANQMPPSNLAPLVAQQAVTTGKSVTFIAFADGIPPPSYQWQVSINDGAWTDLDNSATYKGVTTAMLTIAGATDGMNNYRYRYIADNGCGTMASNPLTLRITAAILPGLSGIALDAFGNLYASDTTTHTIQKITPQFVATPFAGSPNTPGSTNATGTAARFNKPQALAFDSAGNLLVADSGNAAIRKITPAGTATTLATGFNAPAGIAIDIFGNAYIADPAAHTISYMTASGNVSLHAGATGQSGAIAGIGPSARFNAPTRVLIDPQGHLYIADTGNHLIRTESANGMMLLYAGAAGVSGTTDSAATASRFNKPQGMAADSAGHIYLADTDNNTIRMISNDGEVMTLAGMPGVAGLRDGTGSNALFDRPSDMTFSSESGTSVIYVADTGNALIRKIILSSTQVTSLVLTASNAPDTMSPPVITTHPASQTVTAGANVTFAAVATGSNLAYQWLKGGMNISGATGTSYVITNVQQSHAGSYSVRVSNAVDYVTSNTATLTVNTGSGNGGGGGGSGGGGGAASMPFLALLALLIALRSARSAHEK